MKQLLALFAAACLAGCHKYQYQHGSSALPPGTVVASIGVNGVVTYNKAQPCAIPIRLARIAPKTGQQVATRVNVSVYGVDPPQAAEYTLRQVGVSEEDSRKNGDPRFFPSQPRLAPPGSTTQTVYIQPEKGTRGGDQQTATLELVLSKDYLARVASLDQLRVQVETLDAVIGVVAADRSAQATAESRRARAALDSADALARRAKEDLDRADRELEDRRHKLIAAQSAWRSDQALALAKLNYTKLAKDETERISVDFEAKKAAGEADTSLQVVRLLSQSLPDLQARADEAAKLSRSRDRDRESAAAEYTRASAIELAASQAADKESSDLRTTSNNCVRTVVCVDAEQYRKERTAKCIPIYDITPFPLSAKQTEYLFGNKIERNYYVIGVTIQNSSDDDRLVNTGMIRISGQALVRSFGDDDPWFTIPVTVAPQSREHVYAILDDEEVNEPRAIFFRALEFTGTLATALATGFTWGEDTITALGIATGIGLPEGKKLWPDRWPGYKRNVVNYAMPNLLKVGKGTSSPAHFLFFSKTQLQGMILDSQLFRVESYRVGDLHVREDRVESAPVNVAHLAFDTLEVPYEKLRPIDNTEPRIRSATEASLRQAITARQAELDSAMADLERAKQNADRFTGIARKSADEPIAAARTALAALIPSAAKLPDSITIASLATLRTRLPAIQRRLDEMGGLTDADLLAVARAALQDAQVAKAAADQLLKDAAAAKANQDGGLKLAEHATDLMSQLQLVLAAAQNLADAAAANPGVAAAQARVTQAETTLAQAREDLRRFGEAIDETRGSQSEQPQPEARGNPKADVKPDAGSDAEPAAVPK